MGGRKPFVLADEQDWLLERIPTKPDLTLCELLAELHGRGIAVSYFALWHILRRAGLRFKKRLSTPVNRTVRTSPDVEAGGVAGCSG